jgi:hypothetical protein
MPPAPVSSPASTNAATTSGVALNLQPAKTTVIYPAAAVAAVGKGFGNITLSVSGQGATITLGADASGNLSSVAIPMGNISEPIIGSGRSLTDPLTLDFYYQLQDVFAFAGMANELGYTISQVAAGQGLTSSGYGLWASSGTAALGTGAFAFGNLTPPAAVPATGSATFKGFTTGMGGAADGTAAFVLTGNVQIIANFANQSVSANLTNFTTSNISYTSKATAVLPSLSGTAAMTGNAYTGPISGGSLTGSINGNFYGSAAQETAGVWQVSGDGNVWMGSFGAK